MFSPFFDSPTDPVDFERLVTGFNKRGLDFQRVATKSDLAKTVKQLSEKKVKIIEAVTAPTHQENVAVHGAVATACKE